MTPKILEIRDSMTFIPAIAIKLDPKSEDERYLLARAGYGRHRQDQAKYILLMSAEGGAACCDPYDWNQGRGRTMPEAHRWLIEHFDEVASGDVIDVEFILGETAAPKTSEARE